MSAEPRARTAALVANCPSCGAELTFRSRLSLYATCATCSTLVVRRDLDVEKVGEVGLLHEDGTLVKRGTRGRYKGKGFEVVGRLQYAFYAPGDDARAVRVRAADDTFAGTWNEWYILFDDGRDGWLGEAHGLFAVSFRTSGIPRVPAFDDLRVEGEVTLGTDVFWVQDLKRARVVSGEGELPFSVEGGYEAPVADLSSVGSAFATIDYSEAKPLVFVGEWVRFDALDLTLLRDGGRGIRMSEPLERMGCPSCGAALEKKAGGTLAIACPYCESVLDAADPRHTLIARYERKQGPPPLIPLNARGTLLGEQLEHLGFVEKAVVVDGETYPWTEHLLYAPHLGYRWLVAANGHWALLTPTMSHPTVQGRTLMSGGRSFEHFQSGEATVTRALGEFPWRVERGETTFASDYIAPPGLFSIERSAGEVAYTVGQYVAPELVQRAFGLTDLPSPSGVAPAQPNPHGRRIQGMRVVTFAAIALLALVQLVTSRAAPERTLLNTSLTFRALEGERELTTEPFRVGPGRPNVEVKLGISGLDNNWAYVQAALTSADTDEVYELAKELSYYHGVDGGERWAEGAVVDDALLGRVAPGTYVLHVAMECSAPRVDLRVVVTEGVPRWAYFGWGLALLLVPWLVTELRRRSFEVRRWLESDHPTGGSS